MFPVEVWLLESFQRFMCLQYEKALTSRDHNKVHQRLQWCQQRRRVSRVGYQYFVGAKLAVFGCTVIISLNEDSWRNDGNSSARHFKASAQTCDSASSLPSEPPCQSTPSAHVPTPLSEAPAVPRACNLIQGRYCTTHLTEPPRQASETAWPAGLEIAPLRYRTVAHVSLRGLLHSHGAHQIRSLLVYSLHLK